MTLPIRTTNDRKDGLHKGSQGSKPICHKAHLQDTCRCVFCCVQSSFTSAPVSVPTSVSVCLVYSTSSVAATACITGVALLHRTCTVIAHHFLCRPAPILPSLHAPLHSCLYTNPPPFFVSGEVLSAIVMSAELALFDHMLAYAPCCPPRGLGLIVIKMH